jgi:AraC-like DNA-binding protein
MREVLADNLRRLMDHHYRESTNRPKTLAKDAGVSLSTVQRILARETGATLDNIESLAGVFHLSAYQILVPMLDAKNPQLIKGATVDEQRLYRMWKHPPRERAKVPA